MKGIQEALGMEAPSHMKGLQVFIADIRNCNNNKELEEKRVEKELAKIRGKFQNPKLSGYHKKKYVWKLLYAYMLGYEVEFGHIQAVQLCSSATFSEKTAGYLAVSLLLSDVQHIVTLVVNSVKNDMNSQNEHIAALALNTVANIGGSEFADNLFSDISKMLLSNASQYSAYIKRKACICLLRLYRKDQDSVRPDVYRKKLAALFHDRDVGLLTSVSGLMLAILEQGTFPVSEWAEIIPSVTQCLQNIVQGDCPEHYEYYHVPAPWLQTKLLRILQFFPFQMFDVEITQRVNAILHNILTKPAAQRTPAAAGGGSKKRCKEDAQRQNRSNAEHSILFEAMNLMIHLEDKCDQETTRTAAGLLGAFISSTDPNIRYLGLETMARLATNVSTHEHLDRYRNLIMEKMGESDISIRRQALNLLYALCRPENYETIVSELLNILGTSDAVLQEELALKVAILAEKNAPNFQWYVDVVFKMLQDAPDSVGDDVWYRVVQVVTGFEDGVDETQKTELQRHAAMKAYGHLSFHELHQTHETLVKLGAYLLGEFGHQLQKNNVPIRARFEALARHYGRGSSAVRAIIVVAAVKMLNAYDDLRGEVVRMLEDIEEVQDVELQQRSVELLQLLRDEDLLDEVLHPMPLYSESVQQNNPLVQRLKFQMKSRAHTRAQLEEAAKSEGGVYKPGTQGRMMNREQSESRGSERELPMPGVGGSSNQLSPSRDNRGQDEESGSEEDEESGSDDDGRAGGASKGSEQVNPRDLWQMLCISPQGRLFVSGGLCLDLRQEYNKETGRLTILFTNNSKETLTNMRVMLPEVPFMRMQQFSQLPQSLAPKEQAQHLVQVQCLRPFMNPALYRVEYVEGAKGVQQVGLMLPAIMTKFITPAEVQVQQFRSLFEKCDGPGSAMAMGQAKHPPSEWANYLTKGFNLFVVPDNTPNVMLGAGTLHTATPSPQQPGTMMTCPIMVQLEFNPEIRAGRFTVRSQHEQVSTAMLKIMESYMLEVK